MAQAGGVSGVGMAGVVGVAVAAQLPVYFLKVQQYTTTAN